MSFSLRPEVKELLEQFGAEPLKKFGQNFLIDKNALRKSVEAAEISPEDTVLEVGPGLGFLTREIAKTAKEVVAVEKDPKMIDVLRETLKNFKNIKLLRADALEFDAEKEIKGKYKIVANIPFYITGHFLRKFLQEEKKKPESMVLLLQKEVAKRICAKPPEMSILGISAQIFGEPKIVLTVPSSSFWPRPKVNSAIVKISNIKGKLENLDENLFFRVVKAGFSHPRKQILNNFSTEFAESKDIISNWLAKNNIDPKRRAETLTIDEWMNLTRNFLDNYPSN